MFASHPTATIALRRTNIRFGQLPTLPSVLSLLLQGFLFCQKALN